MGVPGSTVEGVAQAAALCLQLLARRAPGASGGVLCSRSHGGCSPICCVGRPELRGVPGCIGVLVARSSGTLGERGEAAGLQFTWGPREVL